ncbi:gamma-glutamyltransferase family protein [Acidisphaera sp. L21]|uniref:gamma-glutamyltransferase family protein n=1 Tax=Acidisphaera sp. L21 TaxID=1641851 RepID=UPI00131BED9C|nr:gamma-glutamyltransferase family protein [Acidisphaera sp. L21]
MRHRRAVLLLLLAATRPIAAQEAPRGVAVAPHPLAATAAQQILHAGGTAADAVIAAQMVLAVAEPQSSGLGGGSMLLDFNAATHEVTHWDGRETAPAGATPGMFGGANGAILPATGGRSVGVPGTLRMLEQLYHARGGHLPWADLMAPAIRAAEGGVPVSPSLAAAIAAHADRLRRQPAARALFFTPDGAPLAAGSTLVNQALGQTLRAVAAGGANALQHGPIAADIATTVRGDTEPGLMTVDDLAAYAVKKRAPACLAYRDRTICTAAPPAAGLQVLQALGLLQHFNMGALDLTSADAAQLMIEAERLAAADRALFLADPDYVQVPLAGLLASDYLTARAQGIDWDHAADAPRAGNPAWTGPDIPLAASPPQPEHGTSTIAVVDASGNAVCLTSSLSGAFGSYLLVRGFMLNAAMSDFATQAEQDGRPVANRVQPGKRPATSMTPAFVLDLKGALVAVLGSAGGSRIPAYVVQGVVGLVDWALPPAQAIALPHVAGLLTGAELEAPGLLAALEARSQQVTQQIMRSDTVMIVTQPALLGAADARREGAVAIE